MISKIWNWQNLRRKRGISLIIFGIEVWVKTKFPNGTTGQKKITQNCSVLHLLSEANAKHCYSVLLTYLEAGDGLDRGIIDSQGKVHLVNVVRFASTATTTTFVGWPRGCRGGGRSGLLWRRLPEALPDRSHPLQGVHDWSCLFSYKNSKHKSPAAQGKEAVCWAMAQDVGTFSLITTVM